GESIYLTGHEWLSYWILIIKELSSEFFVDHGYIPCRRGVLFGNWPAQDNFGTDGFEEVRHHARKSRARISFRRRFRTALDANAVIPAITRHGGIERLRYHAHAG